MSVPYKDPLILARRQDIYSKFGANKEDLYDFIIDKIPKRQYNIMLDAGTGNGTFLEICSNKISVDQIMANDIEIRMLCEAHDKKYDHYPMFFQADLNKLQLEDNCLNLITAIHVLYYTRPDEVLEIFYRSLRKNGVLISTANSMHDMQYIQDLHGNVIGTGHHVSRNHTFMLENAKDYLDRVFKNSISYTYENDIIFPSNESLLDFYSDLWIRMDKNGDLDWNLDDHEIELRKEKARKIIGSENKSHRIRKIVGVFTSTK